MKGEKEERERERKAELESGKEMIEKERVQRM